MGDLNYELNRLARTDNLDAAGAANAWAGTSGRELVGALNSKAGTTGLELLGAVNKIAGTTGLDLLGALRAIPTPLPVSGATAWWDASVSTSISTSGTAVTAWADLSGNGRTLTPPLVANRPTTTIHTMNGLNVLTFDPSVTIRLLVAASNFTSAYTAGSFFMVAKGAVGQHGSHILGGGDDSWHTFDGDMYEWFGSNARVGPWTPTFTQTTAHTYAVIAAANDWRAYGNGTLDKTLVSNTVAFTQTPAIGWNGTLGFSGDIAEVILYNSALSTANRVATIAYLKNKWGTG